MCAVPEFLSLFESERLIQELTAYEIDVHNCVFNMCYLDTDDGCKLCSTRKAQQAKYLAEAEELYGEDVS